MQRLNTPRILIIDDSDDDFHLLSRRIKQRWPSAVIEHAPDQQSLVSHLATARWDIVLCDYAMPNLDAAGAQQLCRQAGSQAAFIVCSGMASDHQGVQAMLDGARDYVEKSRPERLLPVLERELASAVMAEEKKRLEVVAKNFGTTDPVTQLPIQSVFHQRVNQVINQTCASTPAWLVTIRLLDFEHQVIQLKPGLTDAALRVISALLKELVPATHITRLAQVEFALFFESATSPTNTSPQQAPDISYFLNKLSQLFAEDIVVEGRALRFRYSVGLAQLHQHGNDCASLLEHAQSVSRLNKQGRIDLLISSALHAKATRRLIIERDLSSAIDKGQLSLYYQPVIDTSTLKIVAAEALLRWQHPTLGRVSPDEFIDSAEDSGLIIRLGQWVIREACHQLKRLQTQGTPMTIAFNCSAPQLSEPGFAEFLLNQLISCQVDPSWLEIELTESAAMADFETTLKTLQKIRRTGVHVALDDFGTGFSSLNHLCQLPVDILKIDKSFIKALGTGQNNEKLLRAIVAMGHALGLTLHAEGIETEDELALLQSLQCERVQGYYFSAPLSDHEFDQWCESHTNRGTATNLA